MSRARIVASNSSAGPSPISAPTPISSSRPPSIPSNPPSFSAFNQSMLFESISSQPSSPRLSMDGDSYGSSVSDAGTGFRIPLTIPEGDSFQQPSSSKSFSAMSSSYAQAQAHRAYLDELQTTGNPIFASAAALSVANSFFRSDPAASFGINRHQGKNIKRATSYSYGQSPSTTRQIRERPPTPESYSPQFYARDRLASEKMTNSFFRASLGSSAASESPAADAMTLLAPSLPGVQDWLSNVLASFDFRNASHIALLPQLALDQKGSRFIQHVSSKFMPCFTLLFQMLDNKADMFSKIFSALLNALPAISQNMFGNYVSQKLLARSSSDQQRIFLDHLRG